MGAGAQKKLLKKKIFGWLIDTTIKNMVAAKRTIVVGGG